MAICVLAIPVGIAVLVCHNAPFDMGLLRAATPESGAQFDNRVLDTVLLSALVWGGTVAHTWRRG